jgi:O-antigen ligase
VIAAYGLARYAIAPPPLDPYEGRLLYQPFGYANALGIVAAIGILLAVGLALGGQGAAARAAALAPVAVLAPTLYLTSSRGAWVALLAGLAVLLALVSGTRTAVVALAAIALATVAATAVALSTHDVTATRLAGENRPHYWGVALEDYRDHPGLGSGAGTYGEYWLHHRPVLTFTRTAHSLYLQSLAELGPLGLALVVAALALPLVALRRTSEPLVAAAAGGYVAYLVHTGVDWDWELPAVTLVGLVCGGALLLATRGDARRAMSSRARTVLLGTVLVLLAVELARLATGPSTPFAFSNHLAIPVAAS